MFLRVSGHFKYVHSSCTCPRFSAYSLEMSAAMGPITCWLKVCLERHTVIEVRRSGAGSIFMQCTVRLPGIPWRLAKGRGTFRARPYGRHMWAQENKLLRDETPSATAGWFPLVIRSARHIHRMWTSIRRGWKKLLDTNKC